MEADAWLVEADAWLVVETARVVVLGTWVVGCVAAAADPAEAVLEHVCLIVC